MIAVVFSKDRALQLDAFLRSWEACVHPAPEVSVLYRATSMRHSYAYDEVFAQHACVFPHRQTTFKGDLLAMTPSAGRVVFFVDDQIFIRSWAVEELTGLSLRLAPHLSWCYPMNQAQPTPQFAPFSDDKLSWRWRDGKGDWGYPLTLDGNVFDATEIRDALVSFDFHSPNVLESALQSRVEMFKDRYGLCYQESRVVNVPWNIVQADQTANRSAGAANADDMLKFWEDGFRVNLQPLHGVMNDSAHQEFPLQLEARP